MADLSDIQAAQSVKIVGNDSSGLENNPVGATSAGDLQVSPVSRNLSSSGSASSLNADAISSTDLQGYQSISVQITGTFVGTLTFQGSNDNSNFVSVQATNVSSSIATPVSTTTGTGLFYVPLLFRYFRLRMTSYTSGTATVTAVADSLTPNDLGARQSNLSQGQLVPTITNKLRIRYNIADVSLPNTGVYQTIYSRSGTGLFFGLQCGFDNSAVNLRLTIDGGQVFDLPLSDIKSFEFNDTTDGRIQMGGFLTAIGNVLDFSTRYAIPQSSSILVEAASNNGANHKLTKYMVIQTEDT